MTTDPAGLLSDWKGAKIMHLRMAFAAGFCPDLEVEEENHRVDRRKCSESTGQKMTFAASRSA
jgi:hypothetical protein